MQPARACLVVNDRDKSFNELANGDGQSKDQSTKEVIIKYGLLVFLSGPCSNQIVSNDLGYDHGYLNYLGAEEVGAAKVLEEELFKHLPGVF